VKSFSLACFLSSVPAFIPLRIHIFSPSETNFYQSRRISESKGEGRANLFANGEVHGVDYNFDRSQKLKASFGYETYPAKWKKQNQELIVLLPVFGKSDAYFTCALKTDVKDYAYVSHDCRLSSEPTSEFRAWMDRHGYDPEHGKDVPVKIEAKPASGPPSQE